MSLAGIAATSFFAGALAPGGHSRTQHIQQDLQQLGQDLTYPGHGGDGPFLPGEAEGQFVDVRFSSDDDALSATAR